MKTIFKSIMNAILRLISMNYIIFLLVGILAMPFILLFGGINGFKESYIDNNDLSYSSYKKMKKFFSEDI